MVRSHLDYCFTVRAPDRKGDIEALQKVEKSYSKMLPAQNNLPYSQRLKACNPSTLHYKCIRGDVIEAYKIITVKYDTLVSTNMSTVSMYVTRGNG